MPESKQTQTELKHAGDSPADASEAMEEDEGKGESDLRLALGIGAAACCLNFGNAFSDFSLLSVNYLFLNASHPALTNHSSIYLGQDTFVAFRLLPLTLAAILLPPCGFLLGRSHTGRIAASLAIASVLGRGLQMITGATAIFVIGQIISSAAFRTLHTLQIFLLLLFFSPLYRPPLLGILLATDHIASALAITLAPPYAENFGFRFVLWLCFGACMVSVVVAVILCHLLYLANPREHPEKSEESPHSFSRTSLLLVFALTLPSVFTMLPPSLVRSGQYTQGIFFASASILTPLIGVAVSASKKATVVALIGAVLTALGLLIEALPHPGSHNLLAGAVETLGRAAMLIALYPHLALFCASRQSLGLLLGIAGSGAAFARLIGCLPQTLDVPMYGTLHWAVLSTASGLAVVMTTILAVLAWIRRKKKKEGERTRLLASR